jgi:hypothetical protein
MVPGTGIEPVTRGFSIRTKQKVYMGFLAPCRVHVATRSGDRPGGE